MKVLQTGLQAQTPVTVYDKTKPYLAGRAFQKSIGGASVLGPPQTGFMNTFTDSAITPLMSESSPNGRIFQLSAVTAGVATIVLYTFDLSGQTAPVYQGKIQLLLPNAAATTHSLKGFKVWDGANAGVTTGWQIVIATTGSVLINGGCFVACNIALSDFSTTSIPTIGMALSNNAKAVYFIQDSTAMGAANNLTAIQGIPLDKANRRLVIHNGLVAATSFSLLDLTPSPTVTSIGANVASSTTPYAGTSPSAYFNLNAATTQLAAGDPVVFTSTAPSNFTVSLPGVAPTVYFARDVQTVLGVVYFNLATTSGGAAVVPASAVSGMSVIRGFGASSSFWTSTKTITTLPGFSGTFLVNNSESICTPLQSLDPAIPSALNNQICVFLATNTNVYLFKLSDITNGATTLPSLDTKNVLGTGTDFTAISTIAAVYSSTTGRVIFVSNSSQFYVKRWVNNVIDLSFGGLNTTWYESASLLPTSFAVVTISSLDLTSGWLFIVGNTTGQRGVLFMDFRSDASFGYSFVTSPVIDTSGVQNLSFLATVEKLFDYTSSMVFSYKTKASSADAAFNDPTTGWTTFSVASDLSIISLNSFTQFRVDFQIAQGSTNSPSQISDLFLAYIGRNEISEYWAGDKDNTTSGTSSPSYVAFAQAKAYISAVPTLFVRGYDVSNNLLFQYDSATNASLFQYSSNAGGTWNNLGTIPNAVGTRVRALIASPPGQLAYVSIRES